MTVQTLVKADFQNGFKMARRRDEVVSSECQHVASAGQSIWTLEGQWLEEGRVHRKHEGTEREENMIQCYRRGCPCHRRETTS